VSKQEDMAAELTAIREQIESLRLRLEAPSHRESLRKTALNDHENPDQRPHSLAETGLRAPETIQEQIQRYVRNEMSDYAAEHQFGTFEEEDDFTEEDHDALPGSNFEIPDYELEPDPDMPRIEDADDSRATSVGSNDTTTVLPDGGEADPGGAAAKTPDGNPAPNPNPPPA